MVTFARDIIFREGCSFYPVSQHVPFWDSQLKKTYQIKIITVADFSVLHTHDHPELIMLKKIKGYRD